MEANSQFVASLVNSGDTTTDADLDDETGGPADSNDNSNGYEINFSVDGEGNAHEDAESVVGEDSDVMSDAHDVGVDAIVINSIADILKIDMKNITSEEVERYAFTDLELTYQFYSWFGRMFGFSVRKSHILRNSVGEILQQSYVCSREGFRQNRGLTLEKRKREPKKETRCGCEAKFRVHIDILTRHWYVRVFEFEHNHELLDGTLCGLLPAHRKMTPTDLADSSRVMRYLEDLRLKDPLMFVAYKVDKDRRLECLFWCDGESRVNYDIFGDVLAFDATYRKNIYNCPVAVFSGVNHHTQTVVFATSIVIRETEETYVWLLEQFLKAMKGKAPISVITDGDVVVKNAIERIFPKAHHRLCAWHLFQNALTNLGNYDIIPYIKKCMLSDIEVNKFEQLWTEMVDIFGLQDNNWINEMYEKKYMWATAYIRGDFFAGIRTTSRCEALHSHIEQLVHSRIDLTDIVQQFQRCLTYFRFKEIESDFVSNYEQPVLQTSLRSIERSSSNQFTREIFYMFRSILKKSLLLRIIECQEMSSLGCIYKVMKNCGNGTAWLVSHDEQHVDFKCSCFRMESLGIPCDHIVAVLTYLNFNELPKSLVLNRWSKVAKEHIKCNRFT